MLKLPRWLSPKSEEHLTDEHIIAVIDDEDDRARAASSIKHLESCWRCLARKQQLESTIFQLVEYRQDLLAPYLPPPPNGEQRLLGRLDQQHEGIERVWLTRLSRRLRFTAIPTMTPSLASLAVIAVAAGLLLFIWRQNAPNLSAHEFLERAAAADPGLAVSSEPGVVYQKVRIHTLRRTLERSLYRDVQRRRRPKPQKLDAKDALLRTSFQIGGVDWDDPLSAANYKNWHDRHAQSDRIARTGSDLLTLTSTSADGVVSQEALTVRAGDFHAVSRTVTIRDVGTLEIAEINYAMLGWTAVNQGLFEPLSSAASSAVSDGAPHASLARSMPPSRAELDEAELSARLALNRLNADATEQIEISQLRMAVQVKGLVETDTRKRELVAQLRQIPHVTASIFSVEELKAHQQPSTSSSVQVFSAVAEPSPLEIFFRSQGLGQDRVSRVSQQLLDASLTVQQESGALSELEQRFGSEHDLGSAAKASLQELMKSHVNRLVAGLGREESILESAQLFMPSAEGPPGSSTLTVAAAENVALCKALILGNVPNPPAAHSIATQIIGSVQHLRALASSLSAKTKIDIQEARPRNDP